MYSVDKAITLYILDTFVTRDHPSWGNNLSRHNVNIDPALLSALPEG